MSLGSYFVMLLLLGVLLIGMLVKRPVLAPVVGAIGFIMHVYWLLAMQFNLWVPQRLLGYWHPWGIITLFLLVTGLVGTSVLILTRLNKSQNLR